MGNNSNSSAVPGQPDLAFTRESPYGTRTEPRDSGAIT